MYSGCSWVGYSKCGLGYSVWSSQGIKCRHQLCYYDVTNSVTMTSPTLLLWRHQLCYYDVTNPLINLSTMTLPISLLWRYQSLYYGITNSYTMTPSTSLLWRHQPLYCGVTTLFTVPSLLLYNLIYPTLSV